MNQPLNRAAQELVDEAIAAAENYFKITNNLLGIGGFSAAIGCISTENPTFYALLSIIFLYSVWLLEIHAYKHKLDMLRKIKHESMIPKTVIKKSPAALISMLFLGCIALGWFNTKGPSVCSTESTTSVSTLVLCKGPISAYSH